MKNQSLPRCYDQQGGLRGTFCSSHQITFDLLPENMEFCQSQFSTAVRLIPKVKDNDSDSGAKTNKEEILNSISLKVGYIHKVDHAATSFFCEPVRLQVFICDLKTFKKYNKGQHFHSYFLSFRESSATAHVC